MAVRTKHAVHQYDSARCSTGLSRGDREIERRIEGLLRWNAMAMVVRANREFTWNRRPYLDLRIRVDVCEVALLHFLRGRDQGVHDQVFFQPHAAPGIYAWAFLEGRLTPRIWRISP